ncbi:MAG: 16S rRNA (cytosine(1402)-N(4))-methyltransferase RsmH [Thermodesulfobacteriota bacterium]
MAAPHRPVLLTETLAALSPRPGGLYVDATLGAGGHAEAILAASDPDGRLLGLDRDPAALALAARRLAPFAERVNLVQDTFDNLAEHLAGLGWTGADGVLLDLGVSSMQLDQAGRGFAFRLDAPLDMRMGAAGESAADLVARLDEKDLARAIRELGEEPLAGRVARAIAREREKAPIVTTGRLAQVVESAIPAAVRFKRQTHPATQTFQGLRILVNDELGQLERFLAQAPRLLKPGGRLAVISYHSLEDRRVKQAMTAWAAPCDCPPRLAVCACGKKPLFTPLTKKAVRPGPEELAANPRARSARLRAARRTEVQA